MDDKGILQFEIIYRINRIVLKFCNFLGFDQFFDPVTVITIITITLMIIIIIPIEQQVD